MSDAYFPKEGIPSSYAEAFPPSTVIPKNQINTAVIEPVADEKTPSPKKEKSKSKKKASAISSEQLQEALAFQKKTPEAIRQDFTKRPIPSSITSPQALPPIQTPVAYKLRYASYFFSVISAIEVVKSVLLIGRLLMVEFPLVESIISTGQLNDELFLRFCLKIGLIILALILSMYAVCFPLLADKKQPPHLRKQIGLIIFIMILLGVSSSLQYVPAEG